MRQLCAQLETGNKKSEKQEYLDIFANSKMWYLEHYEDYQQKLKAEMIQAFCEEFENAQNSIAITGYSDNFGAKKNVFDISEILCKLLLSVYTYGPDATLPVSFPRNSISTSWLDSKLNAAQITELLQLQLSAHNEGQRINLSVFLEERIVRNGLTHRGKISICTSAIRCYNTIRDMLVFMDEECASELPVFSYPEEVSCNTQKFVKELMDFRFGEDSTLLIVNSLRDVPQESRKIIAQLPWTLVIDLDGYSSFGGLRSVVDAGNIGSINDQQLDINTANNFQVRKEYTTWFTCGEFCNFTYYQPAAAANAKQLFFTTKTPFSYSLAGIESKIEDCLDHIIRILAAKLCPLHILYLSSNVCSIVDKLISKCERYFHQGQLPYYFVAAYYEPLEMWQNIKDKLSFYYSDEPNNQPFTAFSCDLYSLFEGIYDHRNLFPDRPSVIAPHRLPSEDGITEIPNNLALNLSDYFDVIYSGIGSVPPEQAEKERIDFCHGNIATWSIFEGQIALPLMRKQEYNRHIDRIRERLKALPNPTERYKKIFNLKHEPGIGGSTLLRHIGWTLHEEYPVLLVQRYNAKIKDLILELYDNRKKGILILADETLNDCDRLKEDIIGLSRACVLIVAGRKGGQIGNKEQQIEFNAITADGEAALKTQFKRYSQLSAEQLKEKDDNYDHFINASVELRNPFMIGLYYQESDFHGTKDYVQQVMEQVHDEREIKTIALLALCDYFGEIGLPRILVDHYLSIPQKSNYTKSYPYAKSVFLIARGFDDKIEVYRSKHYLLSRELLEQCCKRLYGSSLESSLTDLSKLLIDAIHAEYSIMKSSAYHEILERLFINKSSQDQFSRLIITIPTGIYRREVLEHLSERFGKLALASEPNDDELLFRTAAHFYGHLGRICMNRDYGTDNAQDATAYCEKAVWFMEQSAHGSPDPRIYHMLGEAKRIQLQKELESIDKNPSIEEIETFESEINSISEIFDKTSQYGSVDYAIVSKVKMFNNYLKRVYYWKNITKPEDINKLTIQQAHYREEIENNLELAYYLEFSASASEQLNKLEDEYRLDITLGDYGTAIQYYENLISNLSNSQGKDLELQEAKKGLITARMAKYYSLTKTDKTEEPKYIQIKQSELVSILELLEDILGQSFNPGNYRERNQRISAYDRWFHLAKMKGSGRSISKAFHYVDRWIELDQQGKSGDPRPYYYYYALSMLSRLNGDNVDANKTEDHRITCYKNAQNHYSISKIRDVLVKGTGLEQLFDTRFAGRDLSKYMAKAAVSPRILEGTFSRCSADKGYINLKEPIRWAGEEVKFTLGRTSRVNSISENQITHNLGTFAGFTYEQLSAIDMYVKDYTSKEDAPKLAASSKVNERPKGKGAFIIAQLKKQIGKDHTFVPQKVTKNGGISGDVIIERYSYPATLQKKDVTTRLRELVNRKKQGPIVGRIISIDEQSQRLVLSLAEKQ